MEFVINDNMSTFSAISRTNQSCQRLVVFVVFPGITLLDLSGPLQVFNHEKNKLGDDAPYKVKFVSVDGGMVETDASIHIDTDPASQWDGRQIHTLITVGASTVFEAIQNKPLIECVAKLAKQSDRICSVCSGAFVLAATGLLDGRSAVTHWEDCHTLSSNYPKIRVDADSIFLKDGNIWTSAGCSAGIDLALALVSEDLGHDRALEIARSLVAYMVRPGGQLQFSEALRRQAESRSNRFDELDAWVAENLHRDLRVELLAERVNMSPRNFARVYAQTTGQTPSKAVEALRVEAAREFLQSTAHTVTDIATRCGFDDIERMRRAFLRHLKVSPSDYRSRFKDRLNENFCSTKR